MRRMDELAITVIGHDRPGIVADVAEVLAGLGANLTDSTMTRLRGHFAMTLICTGPAAAEVEAALAPLDRRRPAAGDRTGGARRTATCGAGGRAVRAERARRRPARHRRGGDPGAGRRRRQHHRPDAPGWPARSTCWWPRSTCRRAWPTTCDRLAEARRARRRGDPPPRRPGCAVTGEERGAGVGLGDWTPESLDVPGEVLPVVAAPDPVLSRAGDEVDPTATGGRPARGRPGRHDAGLAGLRRAGRAAGRGGRAAVRRGRDRAPQGGDRARHVRAVQRPGGGG